MKAASTFALAAALALASACGTAEEPVAGGGAAVSTAPSVPSDEPPPHYTGEELARMEVDGFPVANEEGLQAKVTQAEFDAQTERVNRHLLEPGTGIDGVDPVYRDVSADVLEAYQVIEAIEVRDGDELVGYWTSHLVSADDYPAELASAEALVAEGGG